MRFFASEIIREKIFLNYQKEIPYSVEIAIDEYREEPGLDRISATVYVARESQKGILIGHKGEMLKRVGTAARIELEKFLGKKVFLQLYVKVSDNWRDSDSPAPSLRLFGIASEAARSVGRRGAVKAVYGKGRREQPAVPSLFDTVLPFSACTGR